jgi:hypothetical protein
MSSDEPEPGPGAIVPDTAADADTSQRQPSPNNQGIDIRQALDILASRTSHDHSHSHSEGQAGCQQSATDESSAMGQTIDLASGETAPDPTTMAEAMEEQKQKLDQDRKAREEQIRSHLQTMSVKDLLQAVMEAQRERVATYRAYDGYVR